MAISPRSAHFSYSYPAPSSQFGERRGVDRPASLCRGRMPRARGTVAYVRDGYGAFRQPKFQCYCCEMLVFMFCGARQYLYVFSLHHNPDLDDRIFDCLLTSKAAVQAEDVHASFLFVCDLNGHHQKWLGSTTTNRHGVAAFDFASKSGCDQLVVDLTHTLDGPLDLLMTDVPDLVQVSVVAPIGNSDHPTLSAVVLMAQAVPNLSVSREFSLNIKLIIIQFIVQYRICSGVTFGLLTILLRF